MPVNSFRWDKLSADQARVLRVLVTASGKDNAIRVDEVAARVRLPRRATQHIVTALLTEHHVPVGTVRGGDRPGWYLCATEEELRENHALFRELALSTLKRGKAFKPGTNPLLARDFFGQAELPLGARHG